MDVVGAGKIEKIVDIIGGDGRENCGWHGWLRQCGDDARVIDGAQDGVDIDKSSDDGQDRSERF